MSACEAIGKPPCKRRCLKVLWKLLGTSLPSTAFSCKAMSLNWCSRLACTSGLSECFIGHENVFSAAVYTRMIIFRVSATSIQLPSILHFDLSEAWLYSRWECSCKDSLFGFRIVCKWLIQLDEIAALWQGVSKRRLNSCLVVPRPCWLWQNSSELRLWSFSRNGILWLLNCAGIIHYICTCVPRKQDHLQDQ